MTQAPGTAPTLSTEGRQLIFTEARSAKRFSERPVDDAVVREALELAKWAPTAINSSPLRVAHAKSAQARAMVLEHAADGNKPRIEKAPVILVACSDQDFHEWGHVLGESLAVQRERYASRPERRSVMAHDNAWLQIGFVIAALRSVGLQVRPMGGFDPAGLTEAMLEGTSWRAELLLIAGYPAEDGDHGAGERGGRLAFEDSVRTF